MEFYAFDLWRNEDFFLNGENVLPDSRFGCWKWNESLRYRFYDENLHFTPRNWKSHNIMGANLLHSRVLRQRERIRSASADTFRIEGVLAGPMRHNFM